jgi:PilZ domain
MSKTIPGRTDARDERRASDRLPLIRHVRYKVLGEERSELIGSGKTRNMSGNGVLFTTKSALPAGEPIELVVSWPARLNGLPMELVLLGRLVRTEETQAAISIMRYYFKTR